MRKIYLFACLSLFVVLCSGQMKEKSKILDSGKIENNTYFNSFFNFKMVLPYNWILQSQNEIEDTFIEGANTVLGGNSSLKSTAEAAIAESAVLVSLYNSDIETNGMIRVIVYNVKNFPKIKTGNDYLFYTRQLFEQYPIDATFSESSRETIDGIVFYKMNISVKYPEFDLEMEEICYSTVLNNYCFNIMGTYIYDDQKNEILKSIRSVKF